MDAQFTAWFMVLWVSNAAADLTGGRALAGMCTATMAVEAAVNTDEVSLLSHLYLLL